MTEFKHECSEENAPKFWTWLQSRGGIAVWKSINLSNPSASWSTPATIRKGDCEGIAADDPEANTIIPYPKPIWQAANEPIVFTDPADVGVFTCELYKAFPVGLQRGDGYSFKLTNGAQRKLDKVMEECEEKHGDSFYRRGVLDIEGASMGVYWTSGIIPISEWIQAHLQSTTQTER